MQDKLCILPAREPTEPGRTSTHNLPTQLTPLIGREQDVAATGILLRRPEVRLLTFTGTDPPMVHEAIDHLVGVTAVQRVNDEEGYYIKTPYIDHLVGATAAERAERYPNVRIFNHDWANPQSIWQRGIRHLIWAGMGGSVIAVCVFCDLGFCSSHEKGQVTIYPLDSTDPAALNDIVRKLAAAKKLVLPTGKEASNPTFLRALLHDVMMVGVALGMTSEEPITHLEWFTSLLQQAGLHPAEHLLVMTLPGSYLDRFAHEQQAPSLPLQPDGGTGTGGRMSAPTTRVFLLPAALYLTTHFPGQPGQLRSVLQHAWDEYNLELATAHPAAHPFVQLAAALSAESLDGACRLLLKMPEGWQALVAWLEQLMEESLGKGGKGIVVFDDQTLNNAAPGYHQDGTLYVRVVTEAIQSAQGHPFILSQSSLASKEPQNRLAALAASFLGWQLSMALYGYLQRIPFAGQPAVENYKARARVLRTQPDPLQITSNWQPTLQDGRLTLLAPHGAMSQDTQRHSDPQRGDSAASASILTSNHLSNHEHR